jgi:hypothetical protein
MKNVGANGIRPGASIFDIPCSIFPACRQQGYLFRNLIFHSKYTSGFYFVGFCLQKN